MTTSLYVELLALYQRSIAVMFCYVWRHIYVIICHGYILIFLFGAHFHFRSVEACAKKVENHMI